MIDLIIAFVAGLLVGWNIFPQPSWVRSLYEKASGSDK